MNAAERATVEDLALERSDEAGDALAQMLASADAAAGFIEALIAHDHFEREVEEDGTVGFWLRGVRLAPASCAAAEKLFQTLPKGAN